MSLTTIDGTYLTGEEAAEVMNIRPGTFWNNRVRHGDAFIKAQHHILPNRIFYKAEDVERVARERAR